MRWDPRHCQWGSHVARPSPAAVGRGGVKPSAVGSDLMWSCLCHRCGAAGHTRGPHGCRLPSAGSRKGDRGSMSPTPQPSPCPSAGTQPLGHPAVPYLSLCPRLPGTSPRCRPATGRRNAAQGGIQTPSSSGTAASLFPTAGRLDGAWPAALKDFSFKKPSSAACGRPWGGTAGTAASWRVPAAQHQHRCRLTAARARRSPRPLLLSGEDNALPTARAHPAERHSTARHGTARCGPGAGGFAGGGDTAQHPQPCREGGC